MQTVKYAMSEGYFERLCVPLSRIRPAGKICKLHAVRPGIKILNCHEYKLLNVIQNSDDESIGCALLGILADKCSLQDR